MLIKKTFFAAVAGLMLVACAAPATPARNTGGQSDIVVRDAWARPTMGMVGAGEGHSHGGHGGSGKTDTAMSSVNSAAYMMIENKGGAPDKLLKASGDVADMIQVHQTKEKDGMMMMEEVAGGLEIPANGSVELRPAGYHIMLMGVKRELKPGDTFQLTLTFQSGKTISVDVTVREP
ncbi:MAG: copper chaperone PCu(A)C [Thermoflexales bacterium]